MDGTLFVTTAAPTHLLGRELEKLCLLDATWSESRGLYTMGRYGVQVSFMKDKATGETKPLPLASLPDFEGVLPPDGHQFIFDCKVCSGSSFSLDNEHFRNRQLSHLLKRARYGVLCCLLLHFNRRELKTKTDEAQTWLFPIASTCSFWQEFARGETHSIGRSDCEEHGEQVEWWQPKQCRTLRPNLLPAIRTLADNQEGR